MTLTDDQLKGLAERLGPRYQYVSGKFSADGARIHDMHASKTHRMSAGDLLLAILERAAPNCPMLESWKAVDGNSYARCQMRIADSPDETTDSGVRGSILEAAALAFLQLPVKP